MPEILFCDNCGDAVGNDERRWISQLAVAVSSANAGESAVLCPPCARLVEKRDEDGLLRAAGLL